ncbi:MAG: ABC transporter permease [Blastocatellia bacterium]|nr:ABC transporter permease [Blastocatellia bacterium]
MIKHLLKIVWNRKRANIFVVTEIALSLLVVFIVAVFAIYYLKNYISPLGYDYENVISIDVYTDNFYPIQIDAYRDKSDNQKEDNYKKIGLLKRALKELSEVETVAYAGQVPHNYGSMVISFTYKNTEFSSLTTLVDTDFAAVMRLKQVQGRWFLEEDKLLTETPIVINERFAKQIFGSEDATGKVIISEKKETDAQSSMNQGKFRVIGVISEYREGGDLAEPKNFMFRLVRSSEQVYNPGLLVRLKPGTTVDFEEQILKKLNQENPSYTYHLELLSEMRVKKIKRLIGPIISMGLVGVFLVLMVAFGLIGVLWQSITQRTKEIGLRRANGATSLDIYKQILGEVTIITLLGLLLGSVLVANLYLLNIDLLNMFSVTRFERKFLAEASNLSALQLFFSSFLASCIFIYLLTFLCAAYPSYLAAKVKPAEALHCD